MKSGLVCLALLVGTAAGALGAHAAEEASAGAAPAAVSLRDKLSINDLQKVLQDLGYRAQVVTGEGTPYLKSQTQGYTYFVNVYDCGENPTPASPCNSVEFVTGSFTTKPAPDAKRLLDWNRDNWWAFGVLDEKGQPYLRSYFSTVGGVSDAAVNNFVDLWDWRVQEFGKLITTVANEGASSAPPPATP